MRKKHTFHKAPVIQTYTEGAQKHTHHEAIATANSEVCMNSDTGSLYVELHKPRLLDAQAQRVCVWDRSLQIKYSTLKTAMDTLQTVHNHLHKSSRETKSNESMMKYEL